MNRDDVLRMAREAGFQHPDAVGDCEEFAYFDLERFAALVAAAEREACAKACEDQGAFRDEIEMALECAWAIRQRNNLDVTSSPQASA